MNPSPVTEAHIAEPGPGFARVEPRPGKPARRAAE